MATTDQQILDKAKDSLARILDTDTQSWSNDARAQHQFEIHRLSDLIDRYERKVNSAAGGRRIFSPVKRINR